DDPAPVRGGERVRDAPAQRDALADREPLPAEALAEALPFEPLEREPWLASARGPVRDVANDARVTELLEHLGFAREALGVLGEIEEMAPEHLERRERPGVPVERAV